MAKDNFFLLLDLSIFPPESDPNKIGAAIKKKRQEWSRIKIQNPAKSAKAQAWLDLIPEMEKMIGDPEILKQQADEARILKVKMERERFKDLDKAISLISLKGSISDKEFSLLCKKFSTIPEPEIKKRIKVPIKTQAKQKAKQKLLEGSIAKQIRDALAIVDKRSLYDFLAMSRTSSLKALIVETKNKDVENKSIANKTAEVTAAGQLIGHCLNLFKTEDSRQAYDATLAREKLASLDKSLDIAGMDKVIQSQEYDQLMKEAVSLGLTGEEAADYIDDYARKRKWSVQLPGVLSIEHMKQCGQCGVMNKKSVKACTSCGYQLEITCPKCKKISPSSHRICGQCGFSLGDMPNALEFVKSGKIALARDERAKAKSLLHQALIYWPNHAEAVNALSQIQTRENQVGNIATALSEALRSKKLYHARQILTQLKDLDPKHPELSKEIQIQRGVKIAENWLHKARNAKKSDEALNAYLNALAEAEDCQAAIEGVAKSPPDPPGTCSVRISHQAISLSWQPSPSKNVTYVVTRNRQSQPKGPEDGKVMAKTTQTVLDDTSAVPGQFYYYGVFSSRKSVSSIKGSLFGPVMRMSEVKSLKVTPGDSRLDFQWEAPPNALEVAVWRKTGHVPRKAGDGERLRGVRLDGATDSGLRNGTQYGYLICAVFRDAHGRPVNSSGISKRVEPTAPPDPVKDLRVQNRGSSLEITWTPPPSGVVNLFHSSKKYSGYPGDILNTQILARLGKPIPVRRQGLVNVNLHIQGECWITPATQQGDIAILGEAVSFTTIERVYGLRGQVSGGRLYLDWSWPKGAKRAVVAFRHDDFPKHHADGANQSITLDEYERRGGFILHDPGNKSHYFSVFVAAESAGGAIYSHGRHCLVAIGDIEEIYYEIRLIKSLFGKVKGALLVLKSKKEQTKLPDSILVKKSGNQPIHKNDGGVILSLPRETDVGRAETVLDIPNHHLQRNAYAKLFLQDPAASKRFRFMSPGKSKLQLF